MARWAVQPGVTTQIQGMGQMIRGNTSPMGGEVSLEVVGGLVWRMGKEKKADGLVA